MKYLLAVLILLFTSCKILGPKHNPAPEDTAFDESKRDWLEVFKHEIKVAVENDDVDAYNFFFEEYMRERIRQVKEAKQKSAGQK